MKKIFKKGFIGAGGVKALRYINRTPRILFWHGVDKKTHPIVESENIIYDTFLKQILYLKRYYDVVSIDEFYYRLLSNQFSNKEIVLTFDDGYKNNLTVVAPILNEHNLPFTVFISTNHISTGDLYPTSLIRLIVFGSGIKNINIPSLKITTEITTAEKRKNISELLSNAVKTLPNHLVKQICIDLIENISDEVFQELKFKYSSIIPLNWDDVKELNTLNCTIGSHCLDHFCCHVNQNKLETKKQIIESKKTIEKMVGTPCIYFAYPNGDFTKYSNECIKDAGYKMGFSTQKLRITNKDTSVQVMPRISVPSKIETFKILVNLYPKR